MFKHVGILQSYKNKKESILTFILAFIIFLLLLKLTKSHKVGAEFYELSTFLKLCCSEMSTFLRSFGTVLNNIQQ